MAETTIVLMLLELGVLGYFSVMILRKLIHISYPYLAHDLTLYLRDRIRHIGVNE